MIMCDKNIIELNEYRSIGTIDQCRKAVAKTEPMEILRNIDTDVAWYMCPACNGDLLYTSYPCCPNCGQSLISKNVRKNE